jgi:hypothetical protein
MVENHHGTQSYPLALCDHCRSTSYGRAVAKQVGRELGALLLEVDPQGTARRITRQLIDASARSSLGRPFIGPLEIVRASGRRRGVAGVMSRRCGSEYDSRFNDRPLTTAYDL